MTINGFRLVGDLTHFMAIVVLMWKIWETQSCVGISARTQALYFVVFITRYLDLVTNFVSVYNTCLKVIFILGSLGTIGLIFKTRATYDKKNDTFRAEILIALAILLALVTTHFYEALECFWTFSIHLEAFALLPQFFMVGKIGQMEPIISFYVSALGFYRALYIANWIFRYYFEGYFDMVSVIGGCVQTFLLCAFFCWYSLKKSVVIHLPTEIVVAEKASPSVDPLTEEPAEGPKMNPESHCI